MTRRLILACMLLAGLAVACDDDQGPPTISASVDPSTVEAGATTTLSVTVENFTLKGHGDGSGHDDDHSHAGDDGTPREGHYHVYLDTTDENPILMGETPTAQLTIDTTPGDHELIVRLHDLQHQILKPEVKAVVPITVLPGMGAGGAGGTGSGGAGGN